MKGRVLIFVLKKSRILALADYSFGTHYLPTLKNPNPSHDAFHDKINSLKRRSRRLHFDIVV
jgi:hypothetical protein